MIQSKLRRLVHHSLFVDRQRLGPSEIGMLKEKLRKSHIRSEELVLESKVS